MVVAPAVMCDVVILLVVSGNDVYAVGVDAHDVDVVSVVVAMVVPVIVDVAQASQLTKWQVFE